MDMKTGDLIVVCMFDEEIYRPVHSAPYIWLYLLPICVIAVRGVR